MQLHRPFVFALGCIAVGCGASPPPRTATPAPRTQPAQPVAKAPADLIGALRRGEIEEALPAWRDARQQASPNADTSKALASVPAGATVTVYFGAWCGDSRRELTRLWNALDLAGPALPFEIHYVGVDSSLEAPTPVDPDLEYVPTFIVTRNDYEVGRVVESAPRGIETDLLALLRGTETGLLTGRPDLQRNDITGGQAPTP